MSTAKHTLEAHKVAGHKYQLRVPRTEPVQSVSPLDRVTRLVAETYTAEDTAFIVRACNSHEDLLAACKALLKVVSAMGIESDSPLWSEEYDAAHIGAREAITKAEGKA